MKHTHIFMTILLFSSQLLLPITGVATTTSSASEETVAEEKMNQTTVDSSATTSMLQTDTTEQVDSVAEASNDSSFPETTTSTGMTSEYEQPAVRSDEPTETIPEISITRKSNAQYAGISLWVSATITNPDNNVIKKGTKIIISGVSSEYFDFTKWSYVDGSTYGTYSVDADKGQLLFTLGEDIDYNGTISLNWFVPTKSVAANSPTQTLTGAFIDTENKSTDVIITNPSFIVTKTPSGGGTETRVQANTSNNGNMAVSDNAKNVSDDGYSIYDPNQKYMPVGYVMDPGNLTVSQTNRTYTFSCTGPDASIDPKLVRVAIRALGETNYMTLDEASSSGYLTYTVNADQTLSVKWTDGTVIAYNRINIPLYAPDVSGKYSVQSTYSADSYYNGASIITLTNKVAYVPGSTGFVPKLMGVADKSLKQGTSIADMDAWLLQGITSTDLTDGDTTNKVKVSDATEFMNAWNNHTNGTYTVTYTVTNSQNQTTTATAKMTIFSDIVVHYQDSTGKTLKPDVTLSGNVGENYSLDTSDFAGSEKNYYYVSASPAILTGKYGDMGQPKEVTLIYAENQQRISGEDYTMYVGEPAATITNFKPAATDKEGNPIAVTADLSGIDFSIVGTHDVVLTAADGQTKTVKLIIKESQQRISGEDYTMYKGDKKATVADFKPAATDKEGNSIAVTADLSDIDFSKIGTYDVVLTAADGQTKTVQLTIKENKQSLDGDDYTMHVGDKKATVADFNPVAIDKEGNPIAVTADLSDIDFSKIGTYEVILTAADGQTKTVQLTILAKNLKPTIDATDQTMYVGDTLTNETVLSWATFKNADGFVQGFEVVGTQIPVSSDDKLTTTGQYTINYYVQSKAKATENRLVEKTITLTVKKKGTMAPETINPSKTIGSGTALPATGSTSAGNVLPSTGEQASILFSLIGTAFIVGASGLYLWMRKVRKS